MATNLINARQEQKRGNRRALERLERQATEGPLAEAPEAVPEDATQRGKPRPANENEPGNAALFARLKRRPSIVPFWFAFSTSLVWVFVFAAIYGPSLVTGPNVFSANNLPQLVVGAMVLALPILVVWTSAYLLWRAQQMRHVSEALVHTALRLIRP